MPSHSEVTVRTAEDADWPAMVLLAATCFGSFRPRAATDAWRTLIPAGGAVVACDGDDVIGMGYYLDLRLTVPGGAVLPMAGVSWVCVAPTHRRRGVLRAMLTELHGRMAASYPVAGLEASEGGIYGRFGYGPASVVETLSVDRRDAGFLDGVPDPGGVRIVVPVDHRDRFEELYERWRTRTPGGLVTPRTLWDQVFADHEAARGGGGPLMALLHDDGFVLYRSHGGGERKSVSVAKLVAITDDAYVALWRTLLGMDLMDTVTIAVPPAEPLPYLLTDARRVRVAGREDGLWLRILDVPTVLAARTYSADLSVVLDVDGDRFALEIANGRTWCTPTDAPADASLSSSVLGSLYLGAHRASAFVAANGVRCDDSRVVTALDHAFASDVPAQQGFGF